jgi:hypothetical protein
VIRGAADLPTPTSSSRSAVSADASTGYVPLGLRRQAEAALPSSTKPAAFVLSLSSALGGRIEEASQQQACSSSVSSNFGMLHHGASANYGAAAGCGEAGANGSYLFNLDEYTDDSESDPEEAIVRTATNKKAAQPMKFQDSKVSSVKTMPSPSLRHMMPQQEPAAELSPCPSSESEEEPSAEMDAFSQRRFTTCSSESEPEGPSALGIEAQSESEPEGQPSSSDSEPEMEEEHRDEASSAASPTTAAASVAENEACVAKNELLRWRFAAAPPCASDWTLIACPTKAASSPKSGKCHRAALQQKVLSTISKASAANKASSTSSATSSSEGLKVSENGWAAQMRLRRARSQNSPSSQESSCTNGEFARKLKSLLNKLSVEKFAQLSTKLTEIGFTSTDHIQILIEEIFERATTQHHFITMYTDLCEMLNDFFIQHPVSDDPRCAFKRLLLNECQRTFERNLEPPADLTKIADFEERTIAETRYKTRMLGNIRFVGALLARHMLASKVLISILDDLLSDPIPEALESVAALLRVTGAVFDTSEWAHFERLDRVFVQLKAMASSKSCCARVKCLLLDVFDLRARGWKDSASVQKRTETPTTLQAVAEKKANEEAPVAAGRSSGKPSFARK